MNLGAIEKLGVMKMRQKEKQERENSREADMAMLVNGYLVLLSWDRQDLLMDWMEKGKSRNI